MCVIRDQNHFAPSERLGEFRQPRRLRTSGIRCCDEALVPQGLHVLFALHDKDDGSLYDFSQMIELVEKGLATTA